MGESMKFVPVLLVATQLAMATPSWGLTGNELLRDCREGPAGVACLGYVAAVMDVLNTGGNVYGQKACMPTAVTIMQGVDVTRHFLESNPQIRHHGAHDLVALALSVAFPCPK
jgi:hypothetical protein